MATQRTVITLGNGQLGLMLGKAAKKLGVPFAALSITEAWDWVKQAGKDECLVTFEQEHVDEELLKLVAARGIPSFPSWPAFSRLKSKLLQKQFLAERGIPSSPFLPAFPWTDACERFFTEHSGAVLKAGRGGYDGKGVWVLGPQGRTGSGESAREVAARIEQPYLEEKVAFEEELAAVVCRSANGDQAIYPTVRSVQLDGICFQVEYSRELASRPAAVRAGEIAAEIAERLDYVGVLAVEFFLRGQELLVNEIAPRVHNSGHFTIDVCEGSQFENHLRAGLGMPLLPSRPSHDAALMVNLLWPPSEKEFAPLFARLSCGPEWPENAKLHWYGKSEARPRRKMGHFTVYGERLAECHALARQILASRWAEG